MLFFLLMISVYQEIIADCPRPTPSENVIVTYPDKIVEARLPEKTMLFFRCKKGYKPRIGGDNFIICLNGHWKVTTSEFYRRAIPFSCYRNYYCPARNPTNGVARVVNETKILYTCNLGYRLIGPKAGICKYDNNETYIGQTKAPVCVEQLMCIKPPVSNLVVTKHCCLSKTLHFFTCEKGFRLIGSSYQYCDVEGNWDGFLPFCEPIPVCKDPGFSYFSKRNGNCCEEDSILEYVCNKGYEVIHKGKNKINCLSIGQWDAPKPICKPIGVPHCDYAPPENNLVVESSFQRQHGVFLSGDLVHFTCPKYYASNHTYFSLQCTSNGTWDSQLPVCWPSNNCTRPRHPRNGKIYEVLDQNMYPVGFEINFICNKGFYIPNGIYATFCNGDIWEHKIPDCIPVRCANPGYIENGLRFGNDFEVGKTIKYTCSANANLIGSSVRVCQENGRWSGITPVCDFGNTDCPDPGIPLHSIRTGNKFNFGNKVVYTCNFGYTLFGNATRECLDNGQWSGNEIQCYGNDEFSFYDKVMDSMTKTMGLIFRSAMEYSVTNPVTRFGGYDSEEGVNLIFILDVSGSISQLQFNQSKEFVKIVIRKVGISYDIFGIRMAVITFSTEAKVIFSTNVVDMNTALDYIDRIKFDKKGTNVFKALTKAKGIIKAEKIGGRKQSKSFIFLITDGRITEGGIPEDEAKELEANYETKIFSIAVGNQQDRDNLKKLSSEVYMFENHNKLLQVVEAAIGKEIDFSTCGMERPLYNLDSNPSFIYSSETSTGRIVGGEKVKGAWPWMVALKLNPIEEYGFDIPLEVWCGAVIIHQKWILTAAHCFDDFDEIIYDLKSDPRNWEVVVGRTNASLTSALEVKIYNMILHPLYDLANLQFDIALVELVNPLRFDYFIRPICLPPAYGDLKSKVLYGAAQEATVIGWGYTKTASVNDTVSESVDVLHEVKMPIQPQAVCQKPFNYTVCIEHNCELVEIPADNYTFCAGSGLDGSGAKDACYGDSGGPIMQDVISEGKSGKVRRWFTIGIVSWGPGCGIKGYYGYYTHVAKLKDWIVENTKVQFETLKISE